MEKFEIFISIIQTIYKIERSWSFSEILNTVW